MEDVAKDPRRSVGELSDEAGVRVADLLTLPEFEAVKVVAGHSGLDRLVGRANIMEVPDIIEWVKPHELLLTTGYPLREVPQGLTALVTELDEAGVSALGIKLRRYIDELPSTMLEEADRCGLPILLLPDGTAFDDLLNAVLGDVLNRQSTILGRSEAAHRAMLGVLLDGGGLDDLVREVSRLVGEQTMVTTPDGRVLARAWSDGPARRRAELMFEPTGRFRTERFAPGVHPVDAATLVVVPVRAGAVDHGRLVALREARAFDEGDLHLLGRAATMAALAITKSLAVQAVEAKYRGDFVRDVLLDRAGTAAEVSRHFETLGWNVARPLVVVVAALDTLSPAAGDPSEVRSRQDAFSHAWASVVGRYDRSAPVVGFAQEVVALVPVEGDASPREVVRDLVRGVSGDGGGGRRSFSTGVSRLVPHPAGIATGYEQARRSVQVGRQLQGTSALAHFDDLGAFRLLSLIEDSGELKNFAAEVLGELADESDPDAADMRATLRVLLDTNFNVAETSRRLHFHYNTLRYRITKLERIVGRFTEDPDLQLDLSLALRVMQMRGL
jgi:purine catabolism regulator